MPPSLKDAVLLFNTSSRLVNHALLLLLTFSLLIGTLAAQNKKGTLVLEPGKPVERELAGGKADLYSLTLTAGQYLNVIVEQRGIDVIVRLLAPDGNRLVEFDSPNGTEGPEPLYWITESSGTYWLEISSPDKNSAAGRYQVRVEELRAVKAQDTKRVAAERLVYDANTLRVEGSKESLEQAIQKLDEARGLFRLINALAREVETVSDIGFTYEALGDKQKAIAYFSESLPLYRAAGDRAGEANSLSFIGSIYRELSEKQKAIDYYVQALVLFRALGDRKTEAALLTVIGAIYRDSGERQKEAEYFAQALPLFRVIADRQSEAKTHETLGLAYFALDETEKAINHYTQALPLFHALGDQRSEANVLFNIGAVYDKLVENQKALDYLNRALSLYNAAGDRLREAGTLVSIAPVYERLSEYHKALDYLTQALSLYRAAGDRAGQAIALNRMGVAYNGLGERQKALDYYNQALTLSRAVGDRARESAALANIARTYNDLGENQNALDYLTQALTITRDIGDRSGEASTLASIGQAHAILGETQKAFDYYNQALKLFRAIGDRDGEASALHYLGGFYYLTGEKQKALDYFTQVLQYRRDRGHRSGVAGTLISMGAIYRELGEDQKALDYYEQALSIYVAIGDRSGEAVALSNIGLFYLYAAEDQKALSYFTRAQSQYRAIGDLDGEAGTFNSIGTIHKYLGEKQKALDYYNQALKVFRAGGNRGGEAAALNNIGRLYYDSGELQKARDYYVQVLPLYRAIGFREREANVLANIAMAEGGLKNLTEAKARIEAAIAIVESARTHIVEQTLRSSYFAIKQYYYHFYIDVLMGLHREAPNKGYDGQALETSERARARSLLEILSEANANIREGIAPELVERERALQQRLNARAQEQMKLLAGKHTEAQVKAMAQEIEALADEFRRAQTEIRQTSPRYAALTQPQPLTLKEIQTQLLDANTILLEYSLGPTSSYLWAVTTDSITSYELPHRNEIETAARRVYHLLSARNQYVEGETPQQRRLRVTQADAQYAQAAAELSRKILAPVAKQLGNKRLLIVADGVLQYIPFAALPDPLEMTAPLVVHHEIINLPSASTLAVLRREIKDRSPAAKAVAILADPVFEEDDERVKKAKSVTAATPRPRQPRRRRRELPLGMERSLEESGLRDAGFEIPRLPGTRQEANKILSLVPEGESLKAFDFAANRAAATTSDLAQYRFIHFATHGFLNSLHPELSGIVLSMVDEQGRAQDGFLRAHDIFNLKLPAELVVLSACQTGLGKEIKGEGLVGLTRGFMYAGSARVVVSLWSVSDAGTAELMTRFYGAMLKDKMRPAEALRAAQVSMLKEKRWEQPFYWAAFTLQGEWR